MNSSDSHPHQEVIVIDDSDDDDLGDATTSTVLMPSDPRRREVVGSSPTHTPRKARRVHGSGVQNIQEHHNADSDFVGEDDYGYATFFKPRASKMSTSVAPKQRVSKMSVTKPRPTKPVVSKPSSATRTEAERRDDMKRALATSEGTSTLSETKTAEALDSTMKLIESMLGETDRLESILGEPGPSESTLTETKTSTNLPVSMPPGALSSLLEQDGQWVITQSGKTQVSVKEWRPTLRDSQTPQKPVLKTEKKTSFWSLSMRDQTVFAPAAWPADIIHLASNYNPLEIEFATRRPYSSGKCTCSPDCRHDTCSNARSYIICDAECCHFDGVCGNSTDLHPSLRLVKATGSDDFAVIATEDIDEGVVLGEYLGELFYESGKGQSRAKNEGYRIHFKLDRDQWGSAKVGIDARTKGSLMRFMNHCCTAPARFYEHGNGRRRAMVVVTTGQIRAGDEITVNYGDELWFTCRCQSCRAAIP